MKKNHALSLNHQEPLGQQSCPAVPFDPGVGVLTPQIFKTPHSDPRTVAEGPNVHKMVYILSAN